MTCVCVCVCVSLQAYICVLMICCYPVPMRRVDHVVTDALARWQCCPKKHLRYEVTVKHLRVGRYCSLNLRG